MKWIYKLKSVLFAGALFALLMVESTWCIAANPSTVDLGVVVALSGQAQAYGQAVLNGAWMAVDEINQQGGVLNHRLDLVVMDNKSSALHAREAALKSVYRKVVGVVGAVWSSHSMAMAPVLQKHHIPMISPGSTAPKVTQVGNFIFRACYTDAYQGKFMADFAFNGMGRTRAAILTNINETYSQSLAHYFAHHFLSSGGEVVMEKGYKGSAIDFRDNLNILKRVQPDVIFIPGYSRDSGLIIRQARRMGFDTPFLGGDAWETSISTIAGGALEGCYFSTFWHPEMPYPRNKAFVRQYRAIYGPKKISAYAPLGYDAVWLFADAIVRSKSLDPETIRDALAGTQGYEGATGHFSFNVYGDPVRKSGIILQFHKGQWRLFKNH